MNSDNSGIVRGSRLIGVMVVVVCIALGLASLRTCALVVTVFPVEFSADLVTTEQGNPEPPMVGKVYASKARIRVDTSSDGAGIGQIVNIEKKESWQIFYKTKLARDISAVTAEFDPFYLVPPPDFYSTKPLDPAKPCDTPMTSTTCRLLDIEEISGRKCQKVVKTITPDNGASPDTTTWLIWIDLKLFYPLKVQSGVRTVELKNIQIGPQPDSVFEIPSGFKKTVFSHNDVMGLFAPPVKH
jgi:hypothetical protein